MSMTEHSYHCRYVYPYAAIGDALQARLDASVWGADVGASSSVKMNGSGGEADASSAAMLEGRLEHQNAWRAIICSALNSRCVAAGAPSSALPFEVAYAGETALAMMTPSSQLHYYVGFNTLEGRLSEAEAAQRASADSIRAALGFDASDPQDAPLVGKVVREFAESFVGGSLSRQPQPADENEWGGGVGGRSDAITVVLDRREGMFGFVIRNVPLCPPRQRQCVGGTALGCGCCESLDGNDEGGTALRTRRLLVDIRVTLPAGVGPAVNADTQFLMEAVGSQPFLGTALRGALLWARAQRMYLDDASFTRLYATEGREVVLRGSVVDDAYFRVFGTMSLCALAVTAAETEALISVDPSVDDPNSDVSDAARVGRAFVALVRFLASKDHFTLGTTPGATAAEASFPLVVPTLAGHGRKTMRLSAAISRAGTALRGSSSREGVDCRRQFHYARDVAEATDVLLSTDPQCLEEDVFRRYFVIGAEGAGGYTDECSPLHRWLDAILFGAALEGKNDNQFVDPIRTVRSRRRCEECGVGNVASSVSKGALRCHDCALAVMRAGVAKNDAAAAASAQQPTVAQQTQRGRGGRGAASSGAAPAVGGGGRGRGGGPATALTSAPTPTPTSAAPTAGSSSRGRGRGRGGVAPEGLPPPPENRSVRDGVNYEGICIGCDRERSYLVGKPLAKVCYNCAT